ncbi:MAG: hypothetical protein KDA41_12925 [Planctomycetales bacterium]|nr:hypothetical protein [Planctomycetales bacterium]
MTRALQTFCLALALLLAADFVAAANKKNNRNSSNKNNAQQQATIKKVIQASKTAAAQAEAVKAAASQTAAAAAAKAGAAQQRIAAMASQMKSMENSVEFAASNLQQMEVALLESQEDDSRVQRAIAVLDEAEAGYAAARAAAFESPDYKAAYQRALASRNKAEELPRVKREFIENNRELQDAGLQLDYARKAFEQARMELLHADPDWKAQVEAVREAKSALAEAKLAVGNGLLSNASASAIFREAASVASAAAASAQQNQARIKSLEAQAKRLQQQRSRSRYNNNNSSNRR